SEIKHPFYRTHQTWFNSIEYTHPNSLKGLVKRTLAFGVKVELMKGVYAQRTYHGTFSACRTEKNRRIFKTVEGRLGGIPGGPHRAKSESYGSRPCVRALLKAIIAA